MDCWSLGSDSLWCVSMRRNLDSRMLNGIRGVTVGRVWSGRVGGEIDCLGCFNVDSVPVG